MSNNTPRRPVAGSRAPASAPRRVAGRAGRPATEPESASTDEPTTAGLDTPVDAPSTEPALSPASSGSPSELSGDATSAPPASKGPTVVQEQRGLLSNRATTKVLAVALAVLLLVGVAELVTWRVAGDGDGGGGDGKVLAFDGTYVVRDSPVRVPMADWRDATDTAIKSVTEILNVSWKDYDKNLDDAAAFITDDFAKEYATTAKDTRARFLETKAEYDFAVVGASVVEATPDEVASLLFLNQFVYKGEGKQRTGPEIYPVRVMVRMVRTDDGWKIDELHAL